MPSHTLTNKKRSQKAGKILKVRNDSVWCESGVTMRQLVDSLFPLIPAVIPEFPSITVGGAICGAALESSSFKYGHFNDCCLEYEIEIEGQIYKASPNENSDLFYGISGSYGTLGRIKKVKLGLIKARRSIELQMIECDALELFANPPDCDFLDAVRFEERTIAMIGRWSDKEPTIHLSKSSPWFYQLIQPGTIVLDSKHYLFRFDRGAFWMGRYLLSYKMLWHALLRQSPKNTVANIQRDPGSFFRKILGRFCSSALLYDALHTIPQKMQRESFFIHDFYTPLDQVERFLEKNRIFPIWLCPVKGTKSAQFFSPHYGRDFWVNVGLYGPYQESMDCYSFELGGRKMLYSGTDLEREDFEKIYFESVREKFSAAKKLPHLYDKLKWNQRSTAPKITTSATT